MKLLMDVTEVAEALGCGRTFVYELIANGDIPIVKLGRLTRVRVRDIEALIAPCREREKGESRSGASTPVSHIIGVQASPSGGPRTVPPEHC